MGEETTWLDLFPGMANLKAVLAHSLGREDATQGWYFRWQMFGDSRFTLSHVYGALIVLVFVIIGGLVYRSAVAKMDEDAIVPPAKFNFRNLIEMFTEAVLSVAEGVMGAKNAKRFLPLMGTLAFFIFFCNAIALIPGFIPPTATLKTNAALALSVFVLTHVFGVKEHGIAYFKHFLGPIIKWYALPLMIMMCLIEIVSHLARPVSLSLRLLGNMAADHKVVSSFFFLVPLFLPIPFLLLGTLVVIVQTLVFTLLSMIYIQGAIAHEEH